MSATARVDAWLWAVRIYKTRSAATTACRAGHVRVGGERAKAAQTVKPGDEVRVRIDGFDRMLVVREPISKRVGAALVAAAMEDRTPRATPPRRRAAPPRGRSPDEARAPRDREVPRPLIRVSARSAPPPTSGTGGTRSTCSRPV